MRGAGMGAGGTTPWRRTGWPFHCLPLEPAEPDRQVLTSAGIPLPDSDQRLAWRFNAIYGLLWRRGREVSRIGLEPYNPFSDLAAAERLLVYHLPTACTGPRRRR